MGRRRFNAGRSAQRCEMNVWLQEHCRRTLASSPNPQLIKV